MKFKQRIVPLLLCACMTVLPACGQGGGQPDEAGQAGPGSSQVSQPDNEVAMGRYIEEQWELPVAGGEQVESIIGPVIQPDGRLAFIFFVLPEGGFEDYENGEDFDYSRFYTCTNGTDWQRETPAWFQELYERERSVYDFSYNSKGECAIYHAGPVYPEGWEPPAEDGEEDGEMPDYDYTYEVSLLSADGELSDTMIGKAGTGGGMVIMRNTPDAEEDSGALENTLGQTVNEAREPAGEAAGQTTWAADESETALEQPNEAQDGAEAATDKRPEIVAGDDGDEGEEDEDGDFYNNFFYANGVVMGEDGNVYVNNYRSYTVYDPESGRILAELGQQTLSLSMVGRQVATMEYGFDGNTVDFYEPVGDAPIRQVKAEMVRDPEGVQIYGLTDGTIYMMAPGGIYRLAANGETWEQLVDGALTTLSMPSTSINRMVLHGDNELLAAAHSGMSRGTAMLLNYVYSPDTPTRPDTELTVYTLHTSKTLQQAAGAFRKQNPNVLVNIETLLDDSAAATVDDAVRALNTELLAGKGPDLLLLDGLPRESYLEKGVLADLSDVIAPLVENGSLLPNVAQGFQQDGSYYSYPVRLVYPTLWGTEEAVAAGGSIESLAQYGKTHRLFGNMHASYLFNNFLPVYYNGLFSADGQVDADALAAYLNGIKTMADTAGGRPGLMDDEDINYSFRLQDKVDTFNDLINLASGQSDLFISGLTGNYDLMEPNGAVYTRNGGGLFSSYDEASVPDEMVPHVFRSLSGGQGNIYIPTSIIGVNAAGSQQELAKEFVACLLGDEIQGTDLEDGYPVNAAALAAGIDRQEGMVMIYSTVNEDGVELMVQMGWPSKTVLAEVADRIKLLDTPVFVNETLQEMMLDEARVFFDGEATAQEAAQAAANRARLMLAE